MYFSRVVFGGASLFVLLLILTLGTGGCSEKSPKVTFNTFKKIDCVTKITVDPTSGVDTHHKAAYVCEGDTVKWDAQHGVTFTVHFPPGACPFNPCQDITDTHATAIVAPQPADLTLYKYTITVNNGSPIDPHVVGGGGY